MQKLSKINVNLTNQPEQRLVPVSSGTKELEQSPQVMSLATVFDREPLGAAASLLQKQMIVGHNLKVALLTLLTLLSAKLRKAIHSEIITEAPLAETEMAAEILRDSMIDAGKMYLKDVPVVVDVFITDNWYER